jgi:cation:H+ antiporter
LAGGGDPSPPFHHRRAHERSTALSPLLLFFLGLLVLLAGAELLVRGSAHLARILGIPAVVVGLTVVALGTSAPEIVVTVRSTLTGRPELALGNVVGSNVFNVLFILGLSALLVPLDVSARLVRLDVPVMVGASFLVWFLARGGGMSRGDGLLLLALAGAYTLFFLVRAARGRDGEKAGQPGGRTGAMDEAESRPGEGDAPAGGSADPPGAGASSVPMHVLLVVAGLAALPFGAEWLIRGAAGTAAVLGIPELVVGLTLLAGGTSLPEVAAFFVAFLRGERDLAVGNVVGSNVYNLLLVLGAGAALSPTGLPVPRGVMVFDFPVMTAVAVACLPIFFTGARIDRWEGALFLGYYLAYLTLLLMGAVEHVLLPFLSLIMLAFVVPLTGVTLGVILFRELRARRGGAPWNEGDSP